MDGLRWLLLVFGLLVVAGVYLYTRRERTRQNLPEEPPQPLERIEPSLLTEHAAGAVAGASTAEGEPDDAQPPQKVVALRLVAQSRGSFAGDELALSLRGIGMRHGKFGIFHRYDGSDEDRIVFSAASLVEPGSFDLTNIKEQTFPGISLFMVLPGPMDGAEGFDLMIAAGRALAQSLDAELLDESGSTLSIQRERYLREEIIQYQHGILVT